jgi:hypothetical protein
VTLKRTPLKRGKPLARGTKQMTRTAINRLPSPKKRQAIRAMNAIRPAIHERSGGWCELRIPGVCEGRATNISHRVPEGQGGKPTMANLLDSCGSGNTGCHGHIESKRDWAYAHGFLVRTGHDPETVPWGLLVTDQ